ncbi:PIN domain-containing protein [Halocatena marina]|uniref:PIN domain-containing protein n=1 Tax=Halocatena marina TaxID=2934937 RepID=A0ABD5YH19_9EURY|nr:PIN domain-containing protein [Halocatena marina]
MTAVEIQLVLFDSWSRSESATVYDAIGAFDIDVIPMTAEAFQAGAELLTNYPALSVFDSIHVGHARVLDGPLISTDTLYPKIDEIENIDPREL